MLCGVALRLSKEKSNNCIHATKKKCIFTNKKTNKKYPNCPFRQPLGDISQIIWWCRSVVEVKCHILTNSNKVLAIHIFDDLQTLLLPRRGQLINFNIPHDISKRSLNSFPNYSEPAASRLDMPCVHRCPPPVCCLSHTLSPHPSLLFLVI